MSCCVFINRPQKQKLDHVISGLDLENKHYDAFFDVIPDFVNNMDEEELNKSFKNKTLTLTLRC